MSRLSGSHRRAAIVNDQGDPARYDAGLGELVDALIALVGDGEFGEVFVKPTTTPLQMHNHAVFDLSAVDAVDTRAPGRALRKRVVAAGDSCVGPSWLLARLP